jgi:hypothetical protein
LPTPERRDALGRDARGPDGAPIALDRTAFPPSVVPIRAPRAAKITISS